VSGVEQLEVVRKQGEAVECDSLGLKALAVPLGRPDNIVEVAQWLDRCNPGVHIGSSGELPPGVAAHIVHTPAVEEEDRDILAHQTADTVRCNRSCCVLTCPVVML